MILSGDIKAMWMRDSMNQLLPYMSLLGQDDKLKKLVLGAVRMQATLIVQVNFFIFSLFTLGQNS